MMLHDAVMALAHQSVSGAQSTKRDATVFLEQGVCTPT